MTSWSTSGLYSNIMESSSDLLDIHAIRRVYPISGFDLLQTAFFHALKTDQQLQPEEFAIDYAQRNFGFSPKSAKSFYNALRIAPYEVNQGQVSQDGWTIRRLKDSVGVALNTLQLLKPVNKKSEFEHIVLMTNIRYNYLCTVEVEADFNQSGFNASQAKTALMKLSSLNAAAVDEEFSRLNKSLLYPHEIAIEESLRNHRQRELISNLTALSRNSN